MIEKDLVEKYELFVQSTMSHKVPKNHIEQISWATDELVAEAGEVKGVLAKARRKKGTIDDDDYDKIIDELGDVLWSLTASALVAGTNLLELMEFNKDKLVKRIAAQ